jgi:hypothetical protein
MPDHRAVEAGLHEGGHSATAALVVPAVPILAIRRSTGYEACTTVDTAVDHLRDDADGMRDEAIRRAAVIISPMLLGCDGVADDVDMFAAFGRAGIPLHRAYQLALDLIATDEHRELRWLVADAMLKYPVIEFDVPVVGAHELRVALREYR